MIEALIVAAELPCVREKTASANEDTARPSIGSFPTSPLQIDRKMSGMPLTMLGRWSKEYK